MIGCGPLASSPWSIHGIMVELCCNISLSVASIASPPESVACSTVVLVTMNSVDASFEVWRQTEEACIVPGTAVYVGVASRVVSVGMLS